MAFQLPPLPYEYNALEPYIDEMTMRLHHDKHHQAYLTNLNNAIAGTDLESLSIEQILAKGTDNLPVVVRNHGGGYANHNLFWLIMAPRAGGEPTGELADAIGEAFGGFAAFKDRFSKAAMGRFGSGWAWLVWDGSKLDVTSTANQDSPIMEGQVPLLGLDVWEHAYYLKYQNRRNEYVEAWWNVVNWPKVAEYFAAARR
jgi:Fe-Mn family superoxide dismutase